ncbi:MULTISPECIES: DUF6573 family protein [Streptosporangium]|uniref:Uncharacterized protein n=1 Tax=Streptosporangium brasiliense TaxID=47480 RepID=A0ABT9RNH0_9ACTN|nr:DUF6573 family protein [Streptosporangium brasiliense]MDP9870381.1 hypothetical protein [Streptosporangium brasiliense]
MSMTKDEMNELFGDDIDVITRADLIADELLREVPADLLENAGIVIPLAMTAAVWADCVEWTDADNNRKGTVQDQAGRLWDVVWMTRLAINAVRRRGGKAPVELYRVPRGGRGRMARRVSLVVHLGPGDKGEPVLTLMQPGED